MDPGVLCAQVYSSVRTVIPLGSNFQGGKTYTAAVNGVMKTFKAVPLPQRLVLKPAPTQVGRWRP